VAAATESIPDSINPPTIQDSTVSFTEQKDTRTITETLQSGTIEQSFMVDGRADEAYISAVVGGLSIGSKHPYYQHAYLVRRRFKTQVTRGTQSQRKTLVTCTWQKRPCIWYPEITSNLSLVSMLTWWSQDDPPQPIQEGVTGWPVLQPQVQVTMRWPRIELTLVQVQQIEDEAGRLLLHDPEQADQTILGYRMKDALLDGVTKKFLWGAANYETAAAGIWDFAIHLRVDPIRSHEVWFPKLAKESYIPEDPDNPGAPPDESKRVQRGMPIKPLSQADLPSVHHRRKVYPYAFTDIRLLLRIEGEGITAEFCKQDDDDRI
jgi:hypothetical protein